MSLSRAEARRLALGAQGFARERKPGQLIAAVRRLGVLQIDSVNVLERAHYLPLYSRMGPYDRDALDRLAHYKPRRLFEYWGHEASLIPVETQPFVRYKMAVAADNAWGGMRRVARERPELLERILAEVRDRGPLPASAIADEVNSGGKGWWEWSDVKRAFEFLFWSGQITSARRKNFQRQYDLPERVLPAEIVATPTPPKDVAQRELLKIAARAMGVATEKDLRDYFRIAAGAAKERVVELVESGDLVPVEVEGWRQTGYLHPDAVIPRAVDARALLCPFDPLIWERDRVERIFGFRYRIEIYVPEPKRVHGYYVLPFLLGDRLVARVDLKSDRQAGVLLAKAIHLEPDAPPGTRVALHDELTLLAGFLGLDYPGSAVSGAAQASKSPTGGTA
ncbi:MAG: uncharacterized protein QOF76_3131 [Solirubrobacteraceae bacterium]|jgi:uncharacterized protein YcaQ|nr:uncharacterized protein [Solirubrobacteraceae bacterium]